MGNRLTVAVQIVEVEARCIVLVEQIHEFAA